MGAHTKHPAMGSGVWAAKSNEPRRGRAASSCCAWARLPVVTGALERDSPHGLFSGAAPAEAGPLCQCPALNAQESCRLSAAPSAAAEPARLNSQRPTARQCRRPGRSHGDRSGACQRASERLCRWSVRRMTPDGHVATTALWRTLHLCRNRVATNVELAQVAKYGATVPLEPEAPTSACSSERAHDATDDRRRLQRTTDQRRRTTRSRHHAASTRCRRAACGRPRAAIGSAARRIDAVLLGTIRRGCSVASHTGTTQIETASERGYG
jgi:hypothetical protein